MHGREGPHLLGGAVTTRVLAKTLLSLRLALGLAGPPPEPVERYCEGHELQERFLSDSSRVRVLLCGRRTGKTVVLRVEAVRAALQQRGEPDVYVVYITNTLSNGKRQFWKPLKRMLRDLGYKFTSNDTDMVLTLTDGGNIRMASASDHAQIEKIRGDGSPLVIIDECGTYPSSLLLALVTEVAEPMTLDVGGRIIFAGTPGPTLSGYWYEKSGPTANGAVYRGDLRSNPHLMRNVPPGPEREAAIEAFLADVRKENGWNEDHPTYVREWLGRWAQDDEVLVFPLSANTNDYPGQDGLGDGPFGLPTHTDAGNKLALLDWRIVIGVDVGVTSASAYVVAASHPQLARYYVLRAAKYTEQLIDDMARTLRQLRADYTIVYGSRTRVPTTVIDAGGMGAIHAKTLNEKLGIPVTPADKREKASSIATTRDDCRSGRLKLVRTDQWGDDPVAPLVEEWHVLCWNEKRDGIADGQEDHATDAGLYAIRELRANRTDEGPRDPKPGSTEWQAQQEQKMVEKMAKAAKRRRRGRGRKVA